MSSKCSTGKSALALSVICTAALKHDAALPTLKWGLIECWKVPANLMARDVRPPVSVWDRLFETPEIADVRVGEVRFMELAIINTPGTNGTFGGLCLSSDFPCALACLDRAMLGSDYEHEHNSES